MAAEVPTKEAPKRGGIHPLYDLYLGGSPLDDEYRPIEANSYSYASQRRNIKTIASIERDLTMARDSITTLKFDGKLEPVTGSTTEVGKERFLQLLERRVEEHGHETFYYVKHEGKVVNLFLHVHNVTLEALTAEFKTRMTPTIADPSKPMPPPFSAFDKYEKGDITMSRLVTESLLTPAFYDKIFVRYGHLSDFKKLPGSCLLLMALETCNASVSHDIDGAAQAFVNLTLDSYPGENVADMINEALRLIRIMKGGYALPVNTGSRLLQKVSHTSCEEFNRKVYNLLDTVKQMEHKYKVLDPRKILTDPSYDKLGPIGLISTLHEIYGRLLTDHDWPALATKLPQSNNATAPAAGSSTTSVSKGAGEKREIICFRCKGSHHIKDCPQPSKGKNKDRDGDKDAATSSDAPAAKKIKTALPAWRYIEPKDLTIPVIDADKKYKFCTKCICRHTGKKGLYLLSHFDSEHQDNFVPPVPANESNLAAVDVPLGIPAATTRDPTSVSSDEDDDIEFQGAWCASVSTSAAATAFADSSIFVESPLDLLDEDVDSPAPAPHGLSDADLAYLRALTPIEREMFLQVEHDLFPGSNTLAVKDESPKHAFGRRWVDRYLATLSPLERTQFLHDEAERRDQASDTPDPTTSFVVDASMSLFCQAHCEGPSIPNVFTTIATWLFSPLMIDKTPATFIDMPWLTDWICLWFIIPFFRFLLWIGESIKWIFDYTLRWSNIAVEVFSITLMIWEGWIWFTQYIQAPSGRLPRRERRRLTKLTQGHRQFSLLAFVPASWMVLTNVIMMPINNTVLFLPRLDSSRLLQAVYGINRNIKHLDDLMMLDMNVWMQMNNIKSTHLFHSLVSPSAEVDAFQNHPFGIRAKSRNKMSKVFVNEPVVYGPSTTENDALHVITPATIYRTSNTQNL